MRERLSNPPILCFPVADSQFILDTDASDTGIAAVLSQVQDGTERVIAYASQPLNKSQRRYCVTQKELLAVVSFVKHFRHYLLVDGSYSELTMHLLSGLPISRNQREWLPGGYKYWTPMTLKSSTGLGSHMEMQMAF